MSAPVDPQPGPDFEVAHQAINSMLCKTPGCSCSTSPAVAALRVCIDAAESALLRAAETERELRHEVAECGRFAAIFGPDGSPPPLLGASHVRWSFQQQAKVIEELRAALARAEQDTVRKDALEEAAQIADAHDDAGTTCCCDKHLCDVGGLIRAQIEKPPWEGVIAQKERGVEETQS